MEKLNKCPVCKSADLSSYIQVIDHSVSKEKFNIDQCLNCGLRFTNPRPDKDEIVKYYESEDYISHSDTNKGFINFLYQQAKHITLNQKLNLVVERNSKKAIELLDYGCGTGDFLLAAKYTGQISATGIEPSETARTRALNKGIKVYTYDEFFSLEPSTYDVITLWHVLEHIHELEKVFTHFLKILKSKGKLIIAIPNSDATDAFIYDEHWAAFDVPRHLYHFNTKSFEYLVNLFPLKIVEKKTMPFDPFYISLLSEKYKTQSSNFLSAFYNGLTGFISGYKDIDKSSSIIFILQRI